MENNTAHINQGRPVYFSYARNSSKKPEWEHISDCVDKLLETLPAKNLEYRVDIRDIGAGGKISSFEQEIGWRSEVVVVVFSDKYFRSMHCMYEFVQIKAALKQYPEKKLFCIKSGDINLSNVNYIMELEDYWLNLKNEYEKIEYHRLREHSGTEKAAWQNGFYLDDIRQLYSFFSAINYSNAASINYDSFVDEIVRYFKTTPKPDFTPKPDQSAAQSQPQTHTAQQQRTAQPQTQTRAAQQSAFAQPQTQTRTAQSQAKPQNAQNAQKSANSQQPAKASSTRTTVIGVIGLIIFFFYLLAKCADSFSNASPVDSNSNVYNNVDNADANAILAKAERLYASGDYHGAIDLYEGLANQGYVVAQYGLGCSYASSEQYEQAVKWFRKAADQGYASAQYSLGCCYMEGYGVRQNTSEAKKWLQKAADQGNELAIEALRNLRY